MRVLFDRDLHVHYGYFDLTDDGEFREPGGHLAGQVNGMCGTAFWGSAHFVTGLHTGSVPLRIEWHETEPPLDEAWEEVVEAPFESDRTELYLSSFDFGEGPLELGGPGPYRVRYCATGMEEAHAADTRLSGEPARDRYLVQIWPAPVSADTVIRQTSETAEYWHGEARSTPPPLTPEQVAAEEARRRAEREAAAAEAARQAAEKEAERVRRWAENGIDEDDPSLQWQFRAQGLDPAHLQAIARLPVAVRRALADQFAREAGAPVDLGSLAWSNALDAVAAGSPVPAPFDDPQQVWQLMYPPIPESQVEIRVTVLEPGAEPPSMDPKAGAVSTILAALHPDPTRALLDTVAARCRSHDAGAFRQELTDLLQIRVPDVPAKSAAEPWVLLPQDRPMRQREERLPRYRTILVDADQWHANNDRRRELQRQERELQRRAEEAAAWGGRPPTAAMRRLSDDGTQIHMLVGRFGFDAVDALLDLAPDRQRHLAVRIAGEACSAVELSVVDWRSALDAALREEPQSPPFDDPDYVTRSLFPIDPVTEELAPSFDLGGHSILALATALRSVWRAGHSDPQRAVVDTLANSLFGPDAGARAAEIFSEYREHP